MDYGAVIFVFAWVLALSFTFQKFPICVGGGSGGKAPIYVRACTHSFSFFLKESQAGLYRMVASVACYG